MSKRFTGLVTIEVPIDIVYSYFRKKYEEVMDSFGSYVSLKGRDLKVIEKVENRKIVFEEKFLFVTAENELTFEPLEGGKTKVDIKIELPWSPWRRRLGESSLLGIKSNLRSIEFMYDLVKEGRDGREDG